MKINPILSALIRPTVFENSLRLASGTKAAYHCAKQRQLALLHTSKH